MLLTITFLAILALIGLISVVRLHTFLAFLAVSLGAGLALGLQPLAILDSIQKGIGGTLGSITAIIALGAMLGKLVAQSGAAQRIATQLMDLVGTRHARWAFLVTGFIVGLPLFYSVGFLLLAPLVITVSYRYKLPALYIGLPMLASLSVTQGYLPPHPAPLAILKQFNADMGLTLFYGIIVSIPAILISGALFGSTVKRYTTLANPAFIAPDLREDQMPSTANSFLTVLLPILLIGLSTFLSPFLPAGSLGQQIIVFAGEPVVSMFLSVLVATYTLGVRRGKTVPEVTILFGDAIKDVAMLFLIFGGAGALKQVLTDGGVSESIAGMMEDSTLHPYVLAWGMAALIRVCTGSSTVSGITTAGFVAPMLATTGVEPNLMVLSIGAGSMMFSHVNDTGFWLFREYFQLSMADTLKTWSVMETLVSVTGLLGVMALSWVLG
ncbi:Gnt-I system high-affinity gluconate transporter [Larkinella arboricola]|uniref:Gnt-I system high-affinity gluconate transporter n=1 Tax=Larkinella arboricola TaxID=643671 RepID=A0A327X0U4_LARAB|nr:gluconate:H+ symporter [Larkinella arboricola]RAK00091.1 Gnt-I system high-affinity gluconate transporter [Larkinella arboricola]